MKRIFLILFSFYFFTVSVGLLLEKHYCGSKVSYSFLGIEFSKGHGCKCNHKEEPKHSMKCCKDTSQLIKAKTDDSKNQSRISINNFSALNFFNTSFVYVEFKETENKSLYRITHSPPIQNTSLFLRDCKLLI